MEGEPLNTRGGGWARGRSALRYFFIALLSGAVCVGVVFAAGYAAGTYSSGTYGGGLYGTGDATVASTPAGSGGGGSGAISFPGYQVASPSGATTTIPSTKVHGLTEEQIQSILSLLASFGADQATINNLNNVLHGQVSTIAIAQPSTSNVFTRDLELGDTGADVKALQQYLNTHGFVLASSGPGSPGNETTIFGYATQYQLIQFQKLHQITPAVGYFGPKTRGVLSAP